MAKLLLRSQIVAPFLWLLAHAAHAQNVDGWNVAPHFRDGVFQGCFMEGKFDGDTVLGITLRINAEWGVYFVDKKYSTGSIQVPAAISVDGDLIAQGVISNNPDGLVTIRVDGVEKFRRFRTGNALQLMIGGQSAKFSLKGTGRAMGSLVDCVQSDGSSSSAAQGVSNPRETIPAREAMVIASNLLSSAGVTGYVFKQSDGDLVSWDLPGRVSGSLAAFRNASGVADELVTAAISHHTKICSGNFVSAKKLVPTTDGVIVRKAAMVCTLSHVAIESSVTVIEKNGVVLLLTHMGPHDAGVSEGAATTVDDAMTKQAVLIDP